MQQKKTEALWKSMFLKEKTQEKLEEKIGQQNIACEKKSGIFFVVI